MYSKDNFIIHTTRNHVDINRVKELLSQSYWAANRTLKDIKL